MNWQHDNAWSGKFMPDIKSVLGQHLLGEASYEEDSKHATDLVVLLMRDLRIAVRMRRRKYACNAKYLQQFTIRTERRSGVDTELAKIIDGWGDFFFYGFEGDDNGRLGLWHLIDLKRFRRGYMRLLSECDCGVFPGELIKNHDGGSSGRAFSYEQFGPGLVVARGCGPSPLPSNTFPVNAAKPPNSGQEALIQRCAAVQQPLLPLFDN